jgi:hypothetical protein
MLGGGGKLGLTPEVNARRADQALRPAVTRPRTSDSALGAVAPRPEILPLVGDGGLPGQPAEKHVPGPTGRRINSL